MIQGEDVSQLVISRFWEKVKKSDGCWLWTGAQMPTGHGNVYLGNGKFINAHRFSYILAYGRIEEGHVVHHVCEEPACVNPSHLRAITRKDHSAEHGLTGMAAIHAAKTTCDYGHPLVQSSRGRICRQCHNQRNAAYRAKRRSER